jgi:hypothetical protein
MDLKIIVNELFDSGLANDHGIKNGLMMIMWTYVEWEQTN